MRDLLNLLESIQLTEGGNIWKADLATKRINQADVLPTVKFLEQITGLPLTNNMLGSTGLKPTSGDLDLGVDSKSHSKEEVIDKLQQWAKKNDPNALIKKSGVSVHFRTPIKGDPKNGYVQSDLMFLDDLPFAKWSMHAPPSYFKGAHKHILMASVAKALGYKWSFMQGLVDRNTGSPVKGGKDANTVAKTLFGPGANAKTIATVENMLAALAKDPDRETKLADFRQQVPELEQYEKDRLTEENDPTAGLSKEKIKSILRANGYEDIKETGNKLQVLAQIPDKAKKNEFRIAVMNEILSILQKELPDHDPKYSNDASLSSLGGIIFDNSPIKVLVKDKGKQGEKSAGVANEIELASMIQSVIEKYGSANVSFTDERGHKLTIDNAINVETKGRDTKGRKKADVVIQSEKSRLPVSIKKLNADMWESADSMFGNRAREILTKLVDDGVVELTKIKERQGKPVYELSKEIVMEPTEEEAMQAIFGSDINPEGGIVIQTFKPEHFKQDGNNIDVDAHAVITNKDDIPESHVMVWLLRNDSDRNNKTLGIAGIRPLAVTLKRGLGTKGEKDVVYVDVDGNVIKGDGKSMKQDMDDKVYTPPNWHEKRKAAQDVGVGRERR